MLYQHILKTTKEQYKNNAMNIDQHKNLGSSNRVDASISKNMFLRKEM
jgi:hypothetical protein